MVLDSDRNDEDRVVKPNKRILILLMMLLAGGAVVGFGARGAEPNTPQAAEESETSLAFLNDESLSDSSKGALDDGKLLSRMMLSIGIVGVLGVATFYVSKKVLPKVTHTKGKEIQVVETTFLGPRKMLHLIQVGNQKLLVGSTNETITTLAHIDDAWLELSKQDLDGAVNL